MLNLLELRDYIVSRYIPVEGLVSSWLIPDLYQDGAPGYKTTGRSRIYDSRTIINTINSNLMFICSACKS
jgi:hypothetical protein